MSKPAAKPKAKRAATTPAVPQTDLAGLMDAAAGKEPGRPAHQTGMHAKQLVERLSMLPSSWGYVRPSSLAPGRVRVRSGFGAAAAPEPGITIRGNVGDQKAALENFLGAETPTLFASEDHSFAAAGQLFWQAFAGSPAFDRTMRKFGVSESARRDLVVIPRPDIGRIDLLVLQDGVSAVMSEKPKVDVGRLARGVAPFSVAMAVDNSRRGLEDVLELMASQPNRVVVAPRPAMTKLASLPVGLTRVTAGPERSSVGVVAQDRQGVIGVTAALHGVADAAAILVEGKPATVLRKHDVQDAVFLTIVPPLAAVPNSNIRVMRGRLPQGLQKASFIGAQSGQAETFISGWDLGLPGVAAYSQRKIYTRCDAQHGDSGAALVTDDGFLVAFAFERSAYDSPTQFCSWMWAASVFDALQLQD